MDPYETTQVEYVRLTGGNPGSFSGEDLPVENVSWMDAVLFANAKSEEKGLTPVYVIREDEIMRSLTSPCCCLATSKRWLRSSKCFWFSA